MKAKILSFTPEHLSQVAQAIQQDQVVGMPTETVYGLAGNARSPLALARIFDTKERPTFDPLIVHVAPPKNGVQFGLRNLEELRLVDLSKISSATQKKVDHLIQKFWPGPLTLVLPKHSDVPDLATSGLPQVAIRMPQHPIAQALILAAGTPLAAPSANRFGRISPTTAQAVAEELGDRIDWILDGGDCQIGLESTIIRFEEAGALHILRHGGTPQEKIEEALGEAIDSALSSHPQKHQSRGALLAPGMLESHYAPVKPFILLPKKIEEMGRDDLQTFSTFLEKIPQGSTVGLIILSGEPHKAASILENLIHYPVLAKTLSASGNLPEAGHQLFSEMRALDASPAQIIFAEPCLIQSGLGHAIADRLKRASAKTRWSTPIRPT